MEMTNIISFRSVQISEKQSREVHAEIIFHVVAIFYINGFSAQDSYIFEVTLPIFSFSIWRVVELSR